MHNRVRSRLALLGVVAFAVGLGLNWMGNWMLSFMFDVMDCMDFSSPRGVDDNIVDISIGGWPLAQQCTWRTEPGGELYVTTIGQGGLPTVLVVGGLALAAAGAAGVVVAAVSRRRSAAPLPAGLVAS